jgi:hypothetical protein
MDLAMAPLFCDEGPMSINLLTTIRTALRILVFGSESINIRCLIESDLFNRLRFAYFE